MPDRLMLLVIDTAEAACSVALARAGEVVARRHDLVGRGHAERLMPMIAELLGQSGPCATPAIVPEMILVDCGPGSFTGVRVGLAAARALALGWGVPVHGYASTALVAAQAFALHDCDEVAVALAGGHGQLFVQNYARAPFVAIDALQSLPPDAALAAADGRMIAGSGAAALAATGCAADRLMPITLDAAAAILLPREQRLLPPRPIYGRLPDAKPKAA